MQSEVVVRQGPPFEKGSTESCALRVSAKIQRSKAGLGSEVVPASQLRDLTRPGSECLSQDIKVNCGRSTHFQGGFLLREPILSTNPFFVKRQDYVHRVGRTGRAGQKGNIFLILTMVFLACLNLFLPSPRGT